MRRLWSGTGVVFAAVYALAFIALYIDYLRRAGNWFADLPLSLAALPFTLVVRALNGGSYDFGGDMTASGRRGRLLLGARLFRGPRRGNDPSHAWTIGFWDARAEALNAGAIEFANSRPAKNRLPPFRSALSAQASASDSAPPRPRRLCPGYRIWRRAAPGAGLVGEDMDLDVVSAVEGSGSMR